MRSILTRMGLRGLVLAGIIVVSLNGCAQNAAKDSLKISTFLNVDSDEYKTLKQRRKFYKKADRLLTNYGFEIRWLNVAYKTVRILELAHCRVTGFFANTNKEIRAFIQNGNKAILDDMLLKVRAVWKSGVILKGQDAMRWDAQILSDEQDLIDSAYEALSEESQQILEQNLKRSVSTLLLGNPDFFGEVTNQRDRWSFGMRKMDYLVTPEMMPEPNQDWRNVGLTISRREKKGKVIIVKPA